LLIWRDTAQLAAHVCSSFPANLREGETVMVTNLPVAHNGVFFLANGFPECVYVNSGKTIKVLSSLSTGGQKTFRWDATSQSIQAFSATSP
jgi:hypothetical protein